MLTSDDSSVGSKALSSRDECGGAAKARLSRRDVLARGMASGALAGVGLTLPGLLRAEAAAGVRSSRKAVINIHLDGGPPQMDMIDMKPDAPSEVRGELKPISTTLTGFQVSELMPQLARVAHRFAFIRSLTGSAGAHDAFQCQSGYTAGSLAGIGGRPAMGSVVSKLQGAGLGGAPPFIDLLQGRPLARNSARPGFLGAMHQPFRPDISYLFDRLLEPHMVKELAAHGTEHATSLSLIDELDRSRVHSRVKLLAGLDRFRRDTDRRGEMIAMDSFTQQAVSILTSGKVAEAMDLSREDPRTLDLYKVDAARIKAPRYKYSDGTTAVKKLLLARRLVEAGVRCVSVSFSDFDTHSNNYPVLRHILPIVDQALYALVTDLEQRGLLDDVTIVAWGEFGRTPRIDPKSAGRHHWPNLNTVMLAGGGMKVGQVIGASDRHAGTAVLRPVHYHEVFATLYRNLGIDLGTATIEDPSGRPRYLVDHGEPIRELF